jgi:hypothetical protein
MQYFQRRHSRGHDGPDRRNKLSDQLTLVREFAPCHANAPLRFGHAEIVEADSRDVHAEGGAWNERNTEAGANEIEDGEQFAGLLNDAGSETGMAAKTQNVIVKSLGGGSRKADEWAVAQTGQAFAGFVGNGTRRGCDQALAKERPCFEFGVSDGRAHDADVDSSVEKSSDLRRRGHVAHLELDQGMAAAKTENRAREHRGNGGDAEADAKSTSATLYGSAGGIERYLRLPSLAKLALEQAERAAGPPQ